MEGLTREQALDILKAIRLPDLASILVSDTTPENDIQVIELDLTDEVTEQEPFVLGFPFKSLFVEEASDVYANVRVKPRTKNQYQKSFPLKQNAAINFDQTVNQAFLYWDAQAGKTMKILVMLRAQYFSGSQLSISGGGVSISDGTTVTTETPVSLSAATADVIAAAASTAKVRTIYNNTGNVLYVGDSTVDSTTGIPVGPGERFPYRGQGALYGYSIPGGEVRVMTEV